MATVTINYDARNKNITSLLKVIMNLGATSVKKTRKTGIEEALNDVKNGRVYEAKDAESLINKCNEDFEFTPLVKSLSGVIKLPDDFDYKTEYGNYLLQKYK